MCVRASSSRVAARAAHDATPSSRLRALADEPVLREREAVARRERVRDDVVGEGAHAPARYRQTRTVRLRATVRPAASRTTAAQHVPALRGALRPPLGRVEPGGAVAVGGDRPAAVEEAHRTDRDVDEPATTESAARPRIVSTQRALLREEPVAVGRRTTRSRRSANVVFGMMSAPMVEMFFDSWKSRPRRATCGRPARRIGACGGSGKTASPETGS